MKVLSHSKLSRPVLLAASDKLVMSYVEVDGVVRHERETVLGVVAPSRQVAVDQAVLFEDEFEGRYVIGVILTEVDNDVAETTRKSPEINGDGDPTEPTDGGTSIGVRRIGPAK